MKKKSYTPRQICTVICVAAIFLTMAFIWSFSIESTAESDARSKTITEIIKPLLGAIVGKEKVTNHLIRKLAHFTEFCLLGIAVCIYISLTKNLRLRYLAAGFLFGIIVASVDETIQIFSERGSQISDVLLDFCGFTGGMLIVILFHVCFRKLKVKQK